MLLYSLCWKSPALFQLRHLCWNLGNDRLVTEKCQLRALDYANSSVTIIQFYSSAARISMVPNTTKSHYGQGDNPGYSPAPQANTGKPRTHQGDILMDNFLSNNSFLMFLTTPQQQLQWLHDIGIAQFKMPKVMSSLWTSSRSLSSALNSKAVPDPHRHLTSQQCDHAHLCGDGAERPLTDWWPHRLLIKHELAGIPGERSIHLLLEVTKKKFTLIFFFAQ